MRYNQVDLLYQQALKYHHHAENYHQSILQDITPFGLRLKKKDAINPISPDFDNQWYGILKDAKRKLLKLLLKEAQEISTSADTEFRENYAKEKELVEKRNLKLKIVLEERRKRKWHKFRNRATVPEKKRINNPLLSNYIENALNRTENNKTNPLDSNMKKKKLRRRAMVFTNSGIPLLNDTNEQSASTFINEKDQHILHRKMRENESVNISSTVNSTTESLRSGVNLVRHKKVETGTKTFETQSSFGDSVLQDSDLSLLDILQSLNN